MLEQVSMPLLLVNLPTRIRDQLCIPEIPLEVTIEGAQGTGSAHPGESDNVTVVGPAETGFVYPRFLFPYDCFRDLTGFARSNQSD